LGYFPEVWVVYFVTRVLQKGNTTIKNHHSAIAVPTIEVEIYRRSPAKIRKLA